ncbi:GerAB/ArcD/ProY family transporter [Gracilibacillus dipsosauri]|uniref:Uncharacterized protein n=1 Tax=Gracilibacillus dipsosauri TaxID=178340 RepID=A0A317L1N1_9BACI|nr:GerAB/ArcD/ProY family transporter [Gracilibacillus dipsosauri]PWU69722.1 hypothetical protein DLJ74_01990 [Gracilibacillus dipsosauri]
MDRITNIQLFTLIVIFEVGSTTLFAIGIGARQDAWIVIVVAYLLSLALIWCYTQFPKMYPQKDFAFILDDLFGKMLARPLLFLFGLYFLHQALHNFYEFGSLIKMTALPFTPLAVILYIFVFVIMYILMLGMEVLVRSIEIVFLYFIIFLILIFVLNFVAEEFDLINLLPILDKGFGSILKEVPSVLGFPFGEVVVVLVFWHFVQQQKSIRKTTYIAVTFSTLILITSVIVMISVLGPDLATHMEIPLLETLLSIHIGMIFTNLDSMGVFIMFVGGFYKTAIHFFAFSIVMTWMVGKRKPNWVIAIFGLLLPILALFQFESLEHQRWKGMEAGVYNIVVYSLIPVFLLILAFVKKWSERKGKKK